MLIKKYVVDIHYSTSSCGVTWHDHEFKEFDAREEALQYRNEEREKDRMGWSVIDSTRFYLRETNIRIVWRYVKPPHKIHGQIKGRPENFIGYDVFKGRYNPEIIPYANFDEEEIMI